MSPRKRTFESPPPRPASDTRPPPRTLVMGEEEKRRMIEAHAARRAPEDRSQFVSLWAGVAICVIAIGAGWVYAMRQAIVNAIQPSQESAAIINDLPGTVNKVWDDRKSSDPILQDVNQAMDRLKQLQTVDGSGAKVTDLVTQAVKQATEEIKTGQATAATGSKAALPKGLVTDN